WSGRMKVPTSLRRREGSRQPGAREGKEFADRATHVAAVDDRFGVDARPDEQATVGAERRVLHPGIERLRGIADLLIALHLLLRRPIPKVDPALVVRDRDQRAGIPSERGRVVYLAAAQLAENLAVAPPPNSRHPVAGGDRQQLAGWVKAHVLDARGHLQLLPHSPAPPVPQLHGVSVAGGEVVPARVEGKGSRRVE